MAWPQEGGIRLTALAEATRYNVVESCRLFLSELAQDTGETADLAVLRGAGMIFPDQVPGSHRLRAVSSVGEVFSLATTANGRAVQAALPRAQTASLIRDEWTRRHFSGSPQALTDQLDAIGQSTLADDLDEHTSGISAIGFAFADWMADLHAISVPVPSSRFAARRRDVAAALRQARGHIARMMAQPNRAWAPICLTSRFAPRLSRNPPHSASNGNFLRNRFRLSGVLRMCRLACAKPETDHGGCDGLGTNRKQMAGDGAAHPRRPERQHDPGIRRRSRHGRDVPLIGPPDTAPA